MLDLSKYADVIHPVANLFPLNEKDIQALCDSIKEIGFRKGNEIVLDKDGRIVEGRKRYIACEMNDIPPRYTYLNEDECPAKVARFLNFSRTHYTEGERAQIGARLILEERKHKDPSIRQIGVRVDQVGEQLNVSGDSVQNAITVETKGTPELRQAVVDGKISVTHGAELAKLPAEEQVKELTKPDPVVQATAATRRKGTLNVMKALLDKLIRSEEESLVRREKIAAKLRRKNGTLKEAEAKEGLTILDKYDAYLKKLRRKKPKKLATAK